MPGSRRYYEADSSEQWYFPDFPYEVDPDTPEGAHLIADLTGRPFRRRTTVRYEYTPDPQVLDIYRFGRQIGGALQSKALRELAGGEEPPPPNYADIFGLSRDESPSQTEEARRFRQALRSFAQATTPEERRAIEEALKANQPSWGSKFWSGVQGVTSSLWDLLPNWISRNRAVKSFLSNFGPLGPVFSTLTDGRSPELDALRTSEKTRPVIQKLEQAYKQAYGVASVESPMELWRFSDQALKAVAPDAHLVSESTPYLLGNIAGTIGSVVAATVFTGGIGGEAIAPALAATRWGTYVLSLASRSLPSIMGGTVGNATVAAIVGATLQRAQDQYDPWRTTQEEVFRIAMGGLTNVVGAGTIGNISKDGVLRYVAKNVGTDLLAGFIGGAGVEGVSAIVGQEGFKPDAKDVFKTGILSAAMAATTGLVVGRTPELYRYWRREYQGSIKSWRATKDYIVDLFEDVHKQLEQENAAYASSPEKQKVQEFISQIRSLPEKPQRGTAWLEELNDAVKESYSATIGSSPQLSTLYNALIDTRSTVEYYLRANADIFKKTIPHVQLDTLSREVIEPAAIFAIGDTQRLAVAPEVQVVAKQLPQLTTVEEKVVADVTRHLKEYIKLLEPTLLDIPNLDRFLSDSLAAALVVGRRGYRISANQPNYVHIISADTLPKEAGYIFTKYIVPFVESKWNVRASLDGFEKFAVAPQELAALQENVARVIEGRYKSIRSLGSFDGFDKVVAPESLRAAFTEAYDQLSQLHGIADDAQKQARLKAAVAALDAISASLDGVLYRDTMGDLQVWVHKPYDAESSVELERYARLGDAIRSFDNKVFRGTGLGYSPLSNFLAFPQEVAKLTRSLSGTPYAKEKAGTIGELLNSTIRKYVEDYVYSPDNAPSPNLQKEALERFNRIIEDLKVGDSIAAGKQALGDIYNVYTEKGAALDKMAFVASKFREALRREYMQEPGGLVKSDIDAVNYLESFRERARTLAEKIYHAEYGEYRITPPWLEAIIEREYKEVFSKLTSDPRVALRFLVGDTGKNKINVARVISQYIESQSSSREPVVAKTLPATSFVKPVGLLSSLTHQANPELWNAALGEVRFHILPEKNTVTVNLHGQEVAVEYHLYPEKMRPLKEILAKYDAMPGISSTDKFVRAIAEAFTGQEYSDTADAVAVLSSLGDGIGERFVAAYNLLQHYVATAQQIPDYWSGKFAADFNNAFIGNIGDWVRAIAGRSYKDYKEYTAAFKELQIDKELINAFKKLESVVGSGLSYGNIYKAIAEGDYTFLTPEMIQDPKVAPFLGSMLRLSAVLQPNIRIPESIEGYVDKLGILLDDNLLMRGGGVEILRSMHGAGAVKLWAKVDSAVTRYLQERGLVQPKPDTAFVEIPTEATSLHEFMRVNGYLPNGEGLPYPKYTRKQMSFLAGYTGGKITSQQGNGKIGLSFLDIGKLIPPLDPDVYPYSSALVGIPSNIDAYYQKRYEAFQRNPEAFIRDLLDKPVILDARGYIWGNLDTYYLLSRYEDIKQVYRERFDAFSRLIGRKVRSGKDEVIGIVLLDQNPMRDSDIQALITNDVPALKPSAILARYLREAVPEGPLEAKYTQGVYEAYVKYFFSPSENNLRHLSVELFGRGAEDFARRIMESAGIEDPLRNFAKVVGAINDALAAINEYSLNRIPGGEFPDSGELNRRMREFVDLKNLDWELPEKVEFRYQASRNLLPRILSWAKENRTVVRKIAGNKAPSQWTFREYLDIVTRYAESEYEHSASSSKKGQKKVARAHEKVPPPPKRRSSVSKQDAGGEEVLQTIRQRISGRRVTPVEEEPLPVEEPQLTEEQQGLHMVEQAVEELSPPKEPEEPVAGEAATLEVPQQRKKRGKKKAQEQPQQEEAQAPQEGVREEGGAVEGSSPDYPLDDMAQNLFGAYVDPLSAAILLGAVARDDQDDDGSDGSTFRSLLSALAGMAIIGAGAGRKLRLRVSRIPLTLGAAAKRLSHYGEAAVKRFTEALMKVGSVLVRSHEMTPEQLAQEVSQAIEGVGDSAVRAELRQLVGDRVARLMAQPELYQEFLDSLQQKWGRKLTALRRTMASVPPIEIPPINLTPERSWGNFMFGYNTTVGYLLGDIWDTAGVQIYGFSARRLLPITSSEFSTAEANRLVEDAIIAHYPALRTRYNGLLTHLGFHEIAPEQSISKDRLAIRMLLGDLFLTWIDPNLRILAPLSIKMGKHAPELANLYLKILEVSPLLVYFPSNAGIHIKLMNALELGIDILREGGNPLDALQANHPLHRVLPTDIAGVYRALWASEENLASVLAEDVKWQIAQKELGAQYLISKDRPLAQQIRDAKDTLLAGLRLFKQAPAQEKAMREFQRMLETISPDSLADILSYISTDSLLLSETRALLELYQNPIFQRKGVEKYREYLANDIEEYKEVWERAAMQPDWPSSVMEEMRGAWQPEKLRSLVESERKKYLVTPEMLRRNPRLYGIGEAEQKRQEAISRMESEFERLLEQQEAGQHQEKEASTPSDKLDVLLNILNRQIVESGKSAIENLAEYYRNARRLFESNIENLFEQKVESVPQKSPRKKNPKKSPRKEQKVEYAPFGIKTMSSKIGTSVPLRWHIEDVIGRETGFNKFSRSLRRLQELIEREKWVKRGKEMARSEPGLPLVANWQRIREIRSAVDFLRQPIASMAERLQNYLDTIKAAQAADTAVDPVVVEVGQDAARRELANGLSAEEVIKWQEYVNLYALHVFNENEQAYGKLLEKFSKFTDENQEAIEKILATELEQYKTFYKLLPQASSLLEKGGELSYYRALNEFLERRQHIVSTIASLIRKGKVTSNPEYAQALANILLHKLSGIADNEGTLSSLLGSSEDALLRSIPEPHLKAESEETTEKKESEEITEKKESEEITEKKESEETTEKKEKELQQFYSRVALQLKGAIAQLAKGQTIIEQLQSKPYFIDGVYKYNNIRQDLRGLFYVLGNLDITDADIEDGIQEAFVSLLHLPETNPELARDILKNIVRTTESGATVYDFKRFNGFIREASRRKAQEVFRSKTGEESIGTPVARGDGEEEDIGVRGEDEVPSTLLQPDEILEEERRQRRLESLVRNTGLTEEELELALLHHEYGRNVISEIPAFLEKYPNILLRSPFGQEALARFAARQEREAVTPKEFLDYLLSESRDDQERQEKERMLTNMRNAVYLHALQVAPKLSSIWSDLLATRGKLAEGKPLQPTLRDTYEWERVSSLIEENKQIRNAFDSSENLRDAGSWFTAYWSVFLSLFEKKLDSLWGTGMTSDQLLNYARKAIISSAADISSGPGWTVSGRTYYAKDIATALLDYRRTTEGVTNIVQAFADLQRALYKATVNIYQAASAVVRNYADEIFPLFVASETIDASPEVSRRYIKTLRGQNRLISAVKVEGPDGQEYYLLKYFRTEEEVDNLLTKANDDTEEGKRLREELHSLLGSKPSDRLPQDTYAIKNALLRSMDRAEDYTQAGSVESPNDISLLSLAHTYMRHYTEMLTKEAVLYTLRLYSLRLPDEDIVKAGRDGYRQLLTRYIMPSAEEVDLHSLPVFWQKKLTSNRELFFRSKHAAPVISPFFPLDWSLANTIINEFSRLYGAFYRVENELGVNLLSGLHLLDRIARGGLDVTRDELNAFNAQFATNLERAEISKVRSYAEEETRGKDLRVPQLMAKTNLNWHLERLRRSVYPATEGVGQLFDVVTQSLMQGRSLSLDNIGDYLQRFISSPESVDALRNAVTDFLRVLPNYFPNIKVKKSGDGVTIYVPGDNKPLNSSSLFLLIKKILPQTWEYIGTSSLLEQVRATESGAAKVQGFFDNLKNLITTKPAIARYGEPNAETFDPTRALSQAIIDYSFPDFIHPGAAAAARRIVNEFYKLLKEAGIPRHPSSIAGDLAGELYSRILSIPTLGAPNTSPITPISKTYVSPEAGMFTYQLAIGIADATRMLFKQLQERGVDTSQLYNLPIVHDIVKGDGQLQFYRDYILPQPAAAIGILRYVESVYKYAENLLAAASRGEEINIPTISPTGGRRNAMKVIAFFARTPEADFESALRLIARRTRGAEQSESMEIPVGSEPLEELRQLLTGPAVKSGVPVSELIASELLRRTLTLRGVQLAEDVTESYALHPALYQLATKQKRWVPTIYDKAQTDRGILRIVDRTVEELASSGEGQDDILRQAIAQIAERIDNSYLRNIPTRESVFLPDLPKPTSFKTLRPDDLPLYALGAALAYEYGWGDQDDDQTKSYMHAAILALAGHKARSTGKEQRRLPYVVLGSTVASNLTRAAATLMITNMFSEQLEQLTGLNRGQINSILLPLFGIAAFQNYFRVRTLTRGNVAKRITRESRLDFDKITGNIFVRPSVLKGILQGGIKPTPSSLALAQSILSSDASSAWLRKVEKFLLLPENSLNKVDTLARVITNISEGTIQAAPLAQGAIAGTNILQAAIGQHFAKTHIFEKQAEQVVFGLNVLAGTEKPILPEKRFLDERLQAILGQYAGSPNWYTEGVGELLSMPHVPISEDLPLIVAYRVAIDKYGPKDAYAHLKAWIETSKKERNRELAAIARFAVELDQKTTEYFNAKLPVEQLHAQVEGMERAFFESQREMFPNIEMTYYAYRAVNDLASAVQLRTAALYSLRPDTFVPVSKLNEALGETIQKKAEISEALKAIEQRMEYVPEEELSSLVNLRDVLKALDDHLSQRLENAQEIVKLTKLSVARRYISRWHHQRGNYRVRWKESIGGMTFDKMRVFETYEAAKKFQDELVTKRQGILEPTIVRADGEGALNILAEGDVQDHLDLFLPSVMGTTALHEREALSYKNVYAEEAIQNIMGSITKVAYDYIGEVHPHVQKNLAGYMVSKLNELRSELRRVGRLDSINEQKIQQAISSVKAGDIEGLLHFVTDRSFGVLTTEFTSLMRRATDPLKTRKDVRGYEETLQTDDDYRNFLLTGISTMLYRAGSAQAKLFKLNTLEEAMQILGLMNLSGSPIAEKIKEATLRLKVPALNPLTMGKSERFSALSRWIISIGALAGNIASMMRNYFEARMQGVISNVYDRLIGRTPLVLRDFFSGPLFDAEGKVRDPLLREIDETAAALGLYSQGKFSDIAEYLRLFDKRERWSNLGFGLQAVSEYESNRVTFLREYRRSLLKYAGKPDAREAAILDGLRAIYKTQGYLQPEGQSQFEYKLNQVPYINIGLTLMTTTMRLLYQAVADVAAFYKEGKMLGDNKVLNGILHAAGYGAAYFLIAGLIRGMTNVQIFGDILNAIEGTASLFMEEDDSGSGLVKESPGDYLKRKAYEAGKEIGLTTKQVDVLYALFSRGWLTALTDYNMATSSNLSQLGETILATKGRAVADLYSHAKSGQLTVEEVGKTLTALISPVLSRAFRTVQQAADGTYYIGNLPTGKPFAAYDIIPFLAMGVPYRLTAENELLRNGRPVFGGIRERRDFHDRLLSISGITISKPKGWEGIPDIWELKVLQDEEFARNLWLRLIDNYYAVWNGRPQAIQRRLADQLYTAYKKYYEKLRLEGVTPDRDLQQAKRTINTMVSDILLAKAFLTTMLYDREFWRKSNVPPPVFPITYRVAGIIETVNPMDIDRQLENLLGAKFLQMLKRKAVGTNERFGDSEILRFARELNASLEEAP